MFTPKWKKEALHLVKGARKFVHYKRDLLKPGRVDEVESRRSDLLAAIKSKDLAKVKSMEHHAFRSHVNDAIAKLRSSKPLTYQDVLATHRRLFHTVYPWAGQDRAQTAPKLTIKKPRVIKPATLVKSGYLESSTDVDEFIEVLRSAMEQALANDERIEIR